MKRILSLFLAFIMFATTFTFNLSHLDKEVFAASSILNTSFNKALVTGGESNFPVEVSGSTSISPETIYFDFPMRDLSIGDTYTLSYINSKDEKINFIVNKEDEEKLNITYENEEDKDTFKGYKIYSGSKADYIPVDDFIKANADPNNQVKDPSSAGLSSPEFIISPGGGFSVKSNNAVYHFLWSADGNTMKYSSDSFPNGYVYDTNLILKDKDDTEKINETKRLLTGIDGFLSKPYANNDIYTDDVVDQSTGTDLDPGSDSVGLDITFDIPKVFEGTTFGNTYSDDKMPVNVNLGSTGAGTFDDRNIQIRISDITSSPVTAESDGEYSTVVSVDSNKIKIHIDGLTAGVIYDNVTLSLVPDTSIDLDKRIVGRQTKVKENVFTFPKYKVVNSGDRYVIVLQPFYGFKGNYVLYENDNFSVSSKYDGDGELTFPTSLNTESIRESNFRIFFSPDKDFDDFYGLNTDDTIHSQKLKFKSSEVQSYIIKPESFSVKEYETFAHEGEDHTKTLVATFNWDMGYKEAIDKKIADYGIATYTYDLQSTLSPNNTDSFSKFDSVEIKVEKDTSDIDGDTDIDELVATYSLTSAHGDTIINTGQNILSSIYRPSLDTDVYVAEPTINFNIGDKSTSGYTFYYPNIYFLIVSPTSFNGDTSVVNLGSSIMDSITLNDNESNILPPPQNTFIDPESITTTFDESNLPTEISFNLEWSLDGIGMYNYLSKLYDKTTLNELSQLTLSSKPKDHDSNKEIVDDVADFDMYFDIYISEDGKYMQNQFGNYPYILNIDGTGETRLTSSKGFDYDVTKNSGDIYFSDINGKSGYTIDGKPAIDELRENEVVAVEKIPIYYTEIQDFITSKDDILRSIKLDGLDINTTYYIYIDTVGIHKFPTGGTTIDPEKTITNYSMLTPIANVTTGDLQDKPDITDKTPAAPDLILEKTTQDSTLLSWNDIAIYNEETGDKINTEYEIIRLEGYQINDNYLDSHMQFGDMFDLIDFPEKVGFKTDKINDKILEWNGTSFSNVSTKTSIYTKDNRLYFEDTDLDANKIYFYYVRTALKVDVDDSFVETFSSWSRISATTMNIQGPTNLKVIQNPSSIGLSDTELDHKTEVMLNFDLPISSTSNIGKELFVQLAIKENNGPYDSPFTINTADLIWSTDTPDENGNINCTYIVEDLNPGTTYSFKVRLISRDNQPSGYSNIVVSKTDIDQDEYDDNEDIENWQEYLLELLKDIIDEPYWILEDNSKTREILYRDEKFEGYCQSQKNRYFTLLPSDSYKTNVYYLPSNALDLLNDKNYGIKVIYDNTEFFLSSDAISPNNDAYREMLKDLKEKKIEDYYLKIVISGNSISSINNTSAATDSITFETSFVGFDKPIHTFEQGIYLHLLEMLEDNTELSEYFDELSDGVKDDISSEDMQDIILDAIDDMEEEFSEDISDEFEDTLSGTKYTYNIYNYDKNLIIKLLENVKGNVQGYTYLNSRWNELTTNNKTMTTNKSGMFAFGIIKISYPNLDISDDMMDIVFKYGLDDYFGQDNNLNSRQYATNLMVIGTTARLLGSKVGEDPVSYLKSKDIYASNRNSNEAIDKDYVYYYIISVYTKRSNIDLNSYNITNYTLLKNMKNIDDRTKKSIQVATEIGLNTDMNFDGDENVTISEYFSLLEKLISILKL